MTDAHDPAQNKAMLAKAETLVEALPYLQRYAGQTFVVKYGGHAMGDPDLADAVAYAAERGRRVLAVVAGHLHHVGTDRDWWVRRDGVLNVNAARVPRVFEDGGRTVRHHVEIRIGAGRADVEQILLS